MMTSPLSELIVPEEIELNDVDSLISKLTEHPEMIPVID